MSYRELTGEEIEEKIKNYLEKLSYVESFSIKWRIHEWEDTQFRQIRKNKNQNIMKEYWEDDKTKYWSEYQHSWFRIEININEAQLVMCKLLEEEWDWSYIYRITPYECDVIIVINGEEPEERFW